MASPRVLPTVLQEWVSVYIPCDSMYVVCLLRWPRPLQSLRERLCERTPTRQVDPPPHPGLPVLRYTEDKNNSSPLRECLSTTSCLGVGACIATSDDGDQETNETCMAAQDFGAGITAPYYCQEGSSGPQCLTCDSYTTEGPWFVMDNNHQCQQCLDTLQLSIVGAVGGICGLLAVCYFCYSAEELGEEFVQLEALRTHLPL